MNHSTKTEDLLDILAGRKTEAEVAQQHGVTEAEVREWRSILADGLSSRARVARRGAWRPLVVAALVVGTFAFAQSLVSFTANAPALAVDVNNNFNALRTWLERKTGPVGGYDIVTDGGVAAAVVTAPTITNNTLSSTTINTTNLNATRVSPSYFAPAYGNWNNIAGYVDTNGGGAGIVNDNVGYQALMIVGNRSAGGPRTVKMWDNLYVNGEIAGNSLRRGSCAWRGTGLPVNADGQYHSVTCNAGEYVNGWRCEATTYLDGNCAVYCCRPD